MDFNLTEEQQLLRDSVAKFVANDYSLNTRRANIASEQGYSQQIWQLFAELGWLSLPLPETYDGLGGSAVDTMVLLQEFGKGLVVEPYIPTVILGAGFISAGGNDERQAALLPAIGAGKLQLALAFAEPQSRFNLADITTTAQRNEQNNGYLLNGHKIAVSNAPTADKLIVAARTSGKQHDRHGISLFLVDANTAGLQKRDYPTVDGLRAADVIFADTQIADTALLGSVDNGLSLLESMTDKAIVAYAAEAVGIMDYLCQTTVEYCKNRQQFGQPIGRFQVLQHRMVDMFIEYQQSKSLLYMAVLSLDGDERSSKRAVSALKARIGQAGTHLSVNKRYNYTAVWGMTDEMSVSHYFKRLTMIDSLFGNRDYHLKRFANS